MLSSATPIVTTLMAAVMLLNSIICFCGGTARVRRSTHGTAAAKCADAAAIKHHCPRHASENTADSAREHWPASPADNGPGHDCPHCQQVLATSSDNPSQDAAAPTLWPISTPAPFKPGHGGMVAAIDGVAFRTAIADSSLLRLHCALNL